MAKELCDVGDKVMNAMGHEAVDIATIFTEWRAQIVRKKKLDDA